MIIFKEIERIAQERAGGAAALKKRLAVPKSAKALRAVADDRYLSLMSLRVFRAGLKHSLVDAKWPAFEERFFGFDPHRVRAMSDEALEALMSDKALIRHWPKIKSVRANAAAMVALDGCGAYLADWPGDDVVGLWDDIAKRFSQMGGNSGPMFLRMAGKDSFILTPDVERALGRFRDLEGPFKSKRARRAAQDAFNHWAIESGRPLCQISQILALAAS
ncbi:MAG: DNA-3-methyladenine glycosylase I [Pseudomonadota bacterium]